MVIRGIYGGEFHLDILGYQFPETPTDSNVWDLNWLLINISIKTSFGHLEFCDPALLTWEVQRLIKWLKSIALGESVNDFCNFVENTISFTFAKNHNGTINLKIIISSEKLAFWINANNLVGILEDNNTTNLTLSFSDLATMVQQLDGELMQYPIRESRDF